MILISGIVQLFSNTRLAEGDNMSDSEILSAMAATRKQNVQPSMKERLDKLSKKFFEGTNDDEMKVFALTTASTAAVSSQQISTLPTGLARGINQASVLCNGLLVGMSMYEYFRRKAEADEGKTQ